MKPVRPTVTTQVPTTIPTVISTTIPTTVSTTVPGTQSSQTAYNGPHVVPGRVQVEDYDNGGTGVAYSDTTPENIGAAGRLAEAVDVRLINGVTDIAYIGPGEWTEYTVTVLATGTYTANLRLAAIATGRQVVLTVDGAQGCTVNVPNTGSYQTYQTVSAPLALTQGTHVIRLAYATGYTSIDWFEIVDGTSTTGRPRPTTPRPRTSVPTTIRTTVPTTAPTAVPTTVQTGVPTTVPTSPTGTLSPSPSSAELQSTLDSANAAGTARLAAMRAAYGAWTIPVAAGPGCGRDQRQTAGLKTDGVTDNTAALQALLNSQSAGATVLYFPAGTYRIDGPVAISKPVTLVGEAGTVFNCKSATGYVFNVNKGGSLSSKMNGVTVTGIVFEGPGVETGPAMFGCWYLQNVHFSYVKFHNVGFAAIRMQGCVDVVVEDSVFDNVFQTGLGYGVVLYDYCDNVIVRDNFFVTKGRHGIATGSATNENVGQYIKRVTVENNYFENFTDQAIDAHLETTGPYVVRGNVIVNSRVGINLRAGIADISNNVISNCPTGILLRNQGVSASSIGSKVDRIVGNTIIGASVGMQVDKTNSVIQSNVMQGTGTAIYLGPTAYTPSSAQVTGNVLEDGPDGFQSVMASSGISLVNNWMKMSGIFQKVVV